VEGGSDGFRLVPAWPDVARRVGAPRWQMANYRGSARKVLKWTRSLGARGPVASAIIRTRPPRRESTRRVAVCRLPGRSGGVIHKI